MPLKYLAPRFDQPQTKGICERSDKTIQNEFYRTAFRRKLYETLDELQPVMAELRESLTRHVSDDFIKMTRTQTEIRVSLSDRVLFAPGSDQLHPAAYGILSTLGKTLAGHPVAARALLPAIPRPLPAPPHRPPHVAA